MLVLIFSILAGLYGIMIVAANLHRRHHIIAFAALLALMTIGVSHSGNAGVVNFLKIVLVYGCFVAASAQPKQFLLATGAVVLFNAVMETYLSGLTKVSALPSIGLLLLACAAYQRHRMRAKALLFMGVAFAVLNFTGVQYRTEIVLAASIGFCLLAFSLKWRAMGSAILFLPIATSTMYFFIGSQFLISPDIASIYIYSVEATASNFERSFFSFAILTSLVEYPLGQSLYEATYGLRDLANTVERTLYDTSAIDPHNFFLFFSMSFGFLGSFVFVIFLWQIYARFVYTGKIGNVFIAATLLPIAGVMMSFFPFSTEPRTVAAVCLGAAMRMSIDRSGKSYRT